MMVIQPTLETWDQKMVRLALELAALRTETEYAKADDKRWRDWAPRYRSLRYAIDLHLRAVPSES